MYLVTQRDEENTKDISVEDYPEGDYSGYTKRDDLPKLDEGVIKEEQMGSYKKFLKVVKSYEDEEILSDFLDSYPKGQDISKSEYERFTEKHLGLSDPEDYRGENWKYIMSESVIKEEQYSGAIIRKGSSDKAKEDTKIVRQALKKAGIKFTNRGEFGMNFKDADLAQIKKVIAGEKVGEFVVSRDVNEGVIKEDYKNDYANSEEDYTDEMVMEKIKDIIKYHELDPSDVLEEIGQEFGIAFEFGRG
jgi:hypothetical protein